MPSRITAHLLICVLSVVGLGTSLRADNRAAGLMNFSSDGRLLACSNRDSGSVTILSYPGLTVLHEVKVGHHPEGVCWVGASHQLACCVYGDDRIVLLDAESGTLLRSVDVFDEPYGIVSSADGKRLFATLEYPGQVISLNPDSGQIDNSWQVGRMPRGLAISGDGSFLLVTEYLTSRLLKLSTSTGEILQTWDGASTDNLCRQVVLAPGDSRAYFTHIRSRVSAAHGNGSIFPYVSVARLDGEKAGTRLRVPMDSLRGARVTANPWDCDVAPDGTKVAVAFAGTNDLYVARVTGDSHVELDYESGLKLGNNPRAVRFSPAGKSLLIYNALDFEVVEHSLADGAVVSKVAVTDCPLSDSMLLGKRLFYTALQPMSSRNWISCSSCHPDGDSDGRTWQQPEGLRSTQPLAGLSWTHPVHWSADRDEVQDFEHTVRGKLMQGQGLMKGSLPDALAEKISGRSQALDALAEYSNSHAFSLSPYAKNGLSEAAKRGREVFFSSTTKCAECHSGPLYSDSQPKPDGQFIKHDVGTGKDDPSELMEPAYDTPTLLGVYRSAPYLHHGRAATLKDLLTTENRNDRHGVTSHLSDEQIDDLTQFLMALPYESPDDAAKAAGLIQVMK